MKKIYLIGSLRNREIPLLGKRLREVGFEVFDDWFAGGYEADDKWQEYETTRGRHYGEALYGLEAKNIFQFDLQHLNSADIGVLLLPAGKSGHLELGYMIGQGKPGYILFPSVPDRWDCMYQFAKQVFFKEEDLFEELEKVLMTKDEGLSLRMKRGAY